MKKETLFIVFDQIPPKEAGGLVATYVSLEGLLKDSYNIEIISAFECNQNAKEQFSTKKIHVINKKNIDNRFYRLLQYFKKHEFKKFFKAIGDGFYFFFKISSTRKKIQRIIQGNQRVIVSSPAAAIFMPKEIPFILEIHTSYKYFYGQNKLGKMQTKLMTKPTLSLFRTQYDAQNAPVNYKTDYIYNFVDNTNIVRNPKPIRNKILYMGRLEKQKNPMRLIELANELNKINSDFILDIYGTGTMVDVIKNRIKELGLENKVVYKGFVNNKNIYKDYSLLWLSSDYEGFGLVIVEAKANGIPTVSTNWGDAVKEVIDHGVDGYIANTNEEYVKYTNQILTNEKLQKELSDNAYQNFAKFSKEKAKEKWLNILENYTK